MKHYVFEMDTQWVSNDAHFYYHVHYILTGNKCVNAHLNPCPKWAVNYPLMQGVPGRHKGLGNICHPYLTRSILSLPCQANFSWGSPLLCGDELAFW
jgi:hypothetical protein